MSFDPKESLLSHLEQEGETKVDFPRLLEELCYDSDEETEVAFAWLELSWTQGKSLHYYTLTSPERQKWLAKFITWKLGKGPQPIMDPLPPPPTKIATVRPPHTLDPSPSQLNVTCGLPQVTPMPPPILEHEKATPYREMLFKAVTERLDSAGNSMSSGMLDELCHDHEEKMEVTNAWVTIWERS